MESVGGVLDRVLRQLGLQEQLPGWRAVEQWEHLVGARVARHTRAVGFRDGVLRVEVDGSAWMQELGFLRRDLIGRIRRELGVACVRDVQFIVPREGTLR